MSREFRGIMDFGILRSHDLRKQRKVAAQSDEYETHYYTQLLDHFSFVSESRTFQQRYFVDKTFWGGPLKSSPISVYLGGESSLDIPVTGIPSEIAPQFKALLLFVEHRYYGESVPDIVGDPLNPVVNTSTFGYLTSEQALADCATLITDFKKNLSAENSPVIVFGGSYAGMLAAWFRLKYPHITVGALASSAPILLFPNVTRDYSFLAVVTKDFRDTSESCYTTIKKSWGEMDRVASQPGGLQNLSNIFNARVPADWRDRLILMYEAAAQYNYSEVINFVFSAVEMNLNIVGYSRYAMPSIAPPKVPTFWFGWQQESEPPLCLLFRKHRSHLTHGGGRHAHGRHNLFVLQTCTEMVFPEAQNPNKTMFPLEIFDLKSYAEGCKMKYGVVPRPNWVTTEYGGHDIRKVLKHVASNIIFSNGLWDPWSSGGVKENISESIVTLPTQNGTHCQDLLQSSPDDPGWLKEQRSAEIEYIKSWIEQYNCQFSHK
eukprot:PITA_17692